MIGTNTVILNNETVRRIFEEYAKSEMFKDGYFSVSDIKHDSLYDTWKITLEGTEKEAADVTES